MPLGGPWYDGADLACAGLGVGLALASVRLFSNGSAVLTLCAVALGAWGLASALRRAHIRGWLADTLHLAIGVLLLLAFAAPTHRWAVLPTPESIQAVANTVRDDFGRFDEDVAPLVARTGHMAVMATLIWVLGLFNSTGAMRLRAPVQAVVPHLLAFLGLGFVARSDGRLAASAAMLASVGLYALTQLAWRNAALHWVPERQNVPARSLRSGAVILAAAALVTAVVTPMLPGSAEPVLELRRSGFGDGGPRTVVSPFVEVGSNLGPRSDELLFTIEAPTARYWRLTALDTYEADKGIWVLSNSYTAVDGELDPGDPSAEEMSLDEVTLEVRALGGIWVPAPEDPVTAVADFGLNWDGGAQSLIRRSGDLLEGDLVDFGTTGGPGTGAGEDLDPGELRTITPADLEGELVDARGAPPELLEVARDLNQDSTPYDTLLALQNHFREDFVYDETIDLSGEADPLERFLATRRGFCQQFSTAFALAARSLGYPARVVVGFTAGDTVAEGTRGQPVFAVRGRHAHAWPEVLFEGVGWVPFEPTPGRGNPATAGITGVPGAQAAPSEGEAAPGELPRTNTAPTTQATGARVPPTTAEGVAGVDPEDPRAADATEPHRSWWPFIIGGSALMLLVAVLFVRRHGRSRGRHDRDPVAREWQQALNAMSQRGLTMATTQTPDEFARHCDAELGLPAMVELAGLESARRWSGRPTDESDAGSAQQAARSITERLADLGSGETSRQPERAGQGVH